MKSIIIICMAAAFVACSTAKKQGQSTTATAPAPTAKPAAKTSEAAKPTSDAVKKEVCESGKDQRSLEVRKTPSGCELSYTKFGESKVVATGKHGIKHCEDTLEKITKTLESDNFKCKEM